MKSFSVVRLVAVLAASSCFAAHATAAGPPTGFAFYGNGDGTFNYANAAPEMPEYTPAAPAYTPAAPAYAPPSTSYASYPANYGYGYASGPYAGYASYGYGGYGGYAGYGYGGCNNCGRHHRHHHCCTFGGNCTCCGNCWDGYCAGDCGYGAGNCGAGSCGGPVKVHRRHRALGCGAGPCVDAACGAPVACAPHRHHCHLRRRWSNACVGGCYSYDGGGSIPSGMYDGSSQPTMVNPGAPEQLPYAPSNEEPRPMPEDPSST